MLDFKFITALYYLSNSAMATSSPDEKEAGLKNYFSFTILCADAPTEETNDSKKFSFYNLLKRSYDKAVKNNLKIVLSDKNAKENCKQRNIEILKSKKFKIPTSTPGKKKPYKTILKPIVMHARETLIFKKSNEAILSTWNIKTDKEPELTVKISNNIELGDLYRNTG
ncbi:hypothetical protein CWI36_1158p0010 [Hamiltosporidium magnivora]|uniref:Uncharacterized protein n=1 Tax=Hamiltosporidium magnivora TaxID=148818 RepID=A0A4Q9L6H3_9MICR|nr:hypothetical protein CWI36_1158p0010 [Hamiltosporidium magnivora]